MLWHRIRISISLSLIGALLAVAPVACGPGADPPTATTPTIPPVTDYTYRIINSFPHDRTAFTQGLVYDSGFFYESTGLVGRSSLRKVEPATGEVLRKTDVPAPYFAEGLALWQNSLVQLTWQSGIGFIYDKATFDQKGDFTYATEGWGLTHDGSRLIMSDGTANLYFLDPATFQKIGQVEVRDDGAPVVRLNELEYIDGKIYANVWQTNRIAVIDPGDGRVTGWIDLAGLLTPQQTAGGTVDVLNGIAYDAAGKRLFVTGKLWPLVFEIELVPQG